VSVITLTSDLGLSDFYVATVKGFILSRVAGAKIVDISHEISPFNLAEAAYVVKNTYNFFPPGSIHLLGIDSSVEEENDFIATRIENHFFLARNNGLISLITEKTPEKIIKLPFHHMAQVLFPMREIMADAACKILQGIGFEEIGTPMESIMMRTNLRPIIEQNFIRGTIIHVDNYGNAITNIARKHLERYENTRKYIVHFSRNDKFSEISFSYNDVPEGEKVCFFNTAELLEISINKGNASKLLGLNVGHTVLVEFN
jgi:S-adenosyl-L-methionine hydrolase (adenosine-forming)